MSGGGASARPAAQQAASTSARPASEGRPPGVGGGRGQSIDPPPPRRHTCTACLRGQAARGGGRAGRSAAGRACYYDNITITSADRTHESRRGGVVCTASCYSRPPERLHGLSQKAGRQGQGEGGERVSTSGRGPRLSRHSGAAVATLDRTPPTLLADRARNRRSRRRKHVPPSPRAGLGPKAPGHGRHARRGAV